MPVALGDVVPARRAVPLTSFAKGVRSTDGPMAVRSARWSTALPFGPAGAWPGGLPDRDLDPYELLALVAAVAADDASWRGLVALGEADRHYACLHRDAHLDVWVLSWARTGDTGWHDHDLSSGAVAVVEGSLIEHNLTVRGPQVQTAVPAGHAYSFGPEHIHRLTGREASNVSIHAYSPPLQRMGQYVVDSTGVLRRTTVAYTEELRSQPAGAALA